jgi:hypothetical protein
VEVFGMKPAKKRIPQTKPRKELSAEKGDTKVTRIAMALRVTKRRHVKVEPPPWDDQAP